MGVRTIIGLADGTQPAAAMYDSVTGTAFGPIFEGGNAPEQVDGFLGWIVQLGHVSACEQIGLLPDDMPRGGSDGSDARTWPEAALAKLVAYWRTNVEVAGS